MVIQKIARLVFPATVELLDWTDEHEPAHKYGVLVRRGSGAILDEAAFRMLRVSGARIICDDSAAMAVVQRALGWPTGESGIEVDTTQFRDVSVRVRLTRTEKGEIENRARILGLSTSDYVRAKLFDRDKGGSE